MFLRRRLPLLMCVWLLFLGAADSNAQQQDKSTGEDLVWAYDDPRWSQQSQEIGENPPEFAEGMIAPMLRFGKIPSDAFLLSFGLTRIPGTESGGVEECRDFRNVGRSSVYLIKCQKSATLIVSARRKIVIPDGLIQALIAKGSIEFGPNELTIIIDQATKIGVNNEKKPYTYSIVEKISVGWDGTFRAFAMVMTVSD